MVTASAVAGCSAQTEKSIDTLRVDTSAVITAPSASVDPEVAAIARAESARVAHVAKGDTLRFAGMSLSEKGIGPLRIGMTVAEAAAALGGGFSDSDIGNPPGCTQAELVGAPPGFAVELENGRVAAIVVESGSIATSAGIRIGDAETRIKTLYSGSRISVLRNPDFEDAHVVIVTPGNDTTSRSRIVFETDGKIVTAFRAGVTPVVEYAEGCA
jgi:hypothetical protein